MATDLKTTILLTAFTIWVANCPYRRLSIRPYHDFDKRTELRLIFFGVLPGAPSLSTINPWFHLVS